MRHFSWPVRMTNHCNFFPPHGAKRYTQRLRIHVRFHTLSYERKVPLFILGPHLFFCILLAFQHVLDYVAGDRSKRKGQKRPLDTGIHYCRVSYMMPEWVTPITVCSLEPGLSLKPWTVITARPTAEQEDSSEIHPVGLRQMSENMTRRKKG